MNINNEEKNNNYELTQAACDPCSIKNEQVNWKGLYEDSKGAWKALLCIIFLFGYGFLELFSTGIFNETTVETEVVKVKILEYRKELLNKLVIEGEFVNDPNTTIKTKDKKMLEVTLPYSCKPQSNFLQKEIYINVYTKYVNYNKNNLYHDFSDINKICEKK